MLCYFGFSFYLFLKSNAPINIPRENSLCGSISSGTCSIMSLTPIEESFGKISILVTIDTKLKWFTSCLIVFSLQLNNVCSSFMRLMCLKNPSTLQY